MPTRKEVPVDRIREMLSQGVKQSIICVRLGVSKSVVSKVANGKHKAAA